MMTMMMMMMIIIIIIIIYTRARLPILDSGLIATAQHHDPHNKDMCKQIMFVPQSLNI